MIKDFKGTVTLEKRKLFHSFEATDNSLLNTLSLRVITADELWAGTDDDVTLELAGENWNIDSDENDFERNSSKSYSLDPKTGIKIADITQISIEKSGDNFLLSGDWLLQGLHLRINGNRVYNKETIHKWLHNNDLVFTDQI